MHVVVRFPRWSYLQLGRLIEIGSARVWGYAVHAYLPRPSPGSGAVDGVAELSCNEIVTATKLLGECVQELMLNPNQLSPANAG